MTMLTTTLTILPIIYSTDTNDQCLGSLDLHLALVPVIQMTSALVPTEHENLQ